MYDLYNLFSNASALSGSENLSTAVNIAKTGAAGVTVGIAVTAHGSGGSGLTSIEIWSASAATATYRLNSTLKGVNNGSLLNSGSIGRFSRQVQTDDAYLRLKYLANGAGSTFTVTAGIASGHYPDQVQ